MAARVSSIHARRRAFRSSALLFVICCTRPKLRLRSLSHPDQRTVHGELGTSDARPLPRFRSSSKLGERDCAATWTPTLGSSLISLQVTYRGLHGSLDLFDLIEGRSSAPSYDNSCIYSLLLSLLHLSNGVVQDACGGHPSAVCGTHQVTVHNLLLLLSLVLISFSIVLDVVCLMSDTVNRADSRQHARQQLYPPGSTYPHQRTLLLLLLLHAFAAEPVQCCWRYRADQEDAAGCAGW